MYALLINDVANKGECWDCPIAYCNLKECEFDGDDCPLYEVENIRSRQSISKEEVLALSKESRAELDEIMGDKVATEIGLFMKKNGLCTFKKENNPIFNCIDVTAGALIIVPKENK